MIDGIRPGTPYTLENLRIHTREGNAEMGSAVCCGTNSEKAKTRCVYPRQVGGGSELLPCMVPGQNGVEKKYSYETSFGRYSNISSVRF